MKAAEKIALINAHYSDILERLATADADAYRFPACKFSVYVDSDGEVAAEEWSAGDNAHYRFDGDYERVYVHTFCYQGFDILTDWWYDGADLDMIPDPDEDDIEQRENDKDCAIEEAITEAANNGYYDEIIQAVLEELGREAIYEYED